VFEKVSVLLIIYRENHNQENRRKIKPLKTCLALKLNRQQILIDRAIELKIGNNSIKKSFFVFQTTMKNQIYKNS
jgi:hypothetical protein